MPIVVDDLNVVLAAAAGRRRASRCRRSRWCRSQSADDIDCADPAGDFADRRRVLRGDQPGVLRRTAGPRPLRPLRRLRRRLHARRGAGARPPSRPSAARWTGEARALVDDCLTGAWVEHDHPRRQRADRRGPRRSSPATSTRPSRPRSSSATRRRRTTSSAAASRRSPASARACSRASTPAPPASATERPTDRDLAHATSTSSTGALTARGSGAYPAGGVAVGRAGAVAPSARRATCGPQVVDRRLAARRGRRAGCGRRSAPRRARRAPARRCRRR